MPYKATVINVMIASPSDVPQERQIVRDLIAEWNMTHDRHSATSLRAIGWETHSTPEMGDRSQAILNRQLLNDADLLVAIFGARLGSPTGVALSGTAEEIKVHMDAGKRPMVYFYSGVPQGEIDAAQYSALEAYKESLKPYGLIEKYDGCEELRDKLRRHLGRRANEILANRISEVSNTIPVQPPDHSISPQASQILVSASADPQGVVMVNEFLSEGLTVESNGVNFVEPGNPRSAAVARWALKELVELGLLDDGTGSGGVYFITVEGYRVAELKKS